MPARRWPQREDQCVGLSLFDLGSAGGPAPHVMLLLEPPRLPLVAGFLAAPGEGVVLDVVERPTQLAALGVLAPEDDAIPLDPALHAEYRAIFRVDEQHAPGPCPVVEEANRSADAAFLLARLGVRDPEVLDGAAIEYPAELELAWRAPHAPVLAVEAEVAIPRADEAIPDPRLFAQGSVRTRRREYCDHLLPRVGRRLGAGRRTEGPIGQAPEGAGGPRDGHPSNPGAPWTHRLLRS